MVAGTHRVTGVTRHRSSRRRKEAQKLTIAPPYWSHEVHGVDEVESPPPQVTRRTAPAALPLPARRPLSDTHLKVALDRTTPMAAESARVIIGDHDHDRDNDHDNDEVDAASLSKEPPKSHTECKSLEEDGSSAHSTGWKCRNPRQLPKHCAMDDLWRKLRREKES